MMQAAIYGLEGITLNVDERFVHKMRQYIQHIGGVDLWIDLVLATDPALLMGLVLVLAVGMTYLVVFHIVLGRTLGMRVLKI